MTSRHRLATGALALVLALPPALLLAGPAQAEDAAAPARPTTADGATDLATAIAAARADFRASALAARLALRTAVRGDAGPLAAATARAAARASLQTARAQYVARVTAAVAQYAPGGLPTRTQLEPAWWVGLTDAEWLGG